MAKAGLEIVGDKELNKLLLRLPEKMLDDVLKKATRSSARRIVTSARKKIDLQDLFETGLLRKSLQVKVKVNKKLGTVRARVWPNKKIRGTAPDGRTRIPFFYAHLVEFGYRVGSGGTLDNKRKSKIELTGKAVVRGHVPARPFLRPALDENRTKITREFDGKTRKFLDKAIAKADAKRKT